MVGFQNPYLGGAFGISTKTKEIGIAGIAKCHLRFFRCLGFEILVKEI